MTAEILTAGHIKCLEWLKKETGYIRPNIMVGLLSEKALKGYKKCVVPFKDRKYILSNLKQIDFLVKQDSLNPYENLKKFEPEAIASGDGWEKSELEAIDKYNKFFRKKYYKDIKIINIKLEGEKVKAYSSSAIKKKIKEAI